MARFLRRGRRVNLDIVLQTEHGVDGTTCIQTGDEFVLFSADGKALAP